MTGRVEPEIRERGGELVVVDPVQRRRVSLSPSGSVDPDPADPDGFYFPVDVAAAVTTDELAVPYPVGVYVRDAEGEPVCEVTDGEERLGDGEYVVELMAPVKLFVRASGAPTVTVGDDSTVVALDEPTAVRVGARSYHERPAATVTTTAAPRDLMATVSTFGSALKTTSPERSFPTLRGHPPALQLGESLSVPDGVAPPDTGVTIAVPADRESVYVVAPLAHYLGATVVEGDPPRIVADGATHRLDDTVRSFEREVARVLRQTFLLDCVVRTEGYYPVPLHGRDRVADRLDRPLATLYDLPPDERLRAYLSVPYDAVREAVPTWRVAAHVTAEPSCAELLPAAVDDLAVVRTATGASAADPATVAVSVEDYVRGPHGSGSDVPGAGAYVSPTETTALTDAWLGSGRPVGANKLTTPGVANRLARSDTSDDVEVVLVCNHPEMAAEVDGGLYGDRADLPFDVTVRERCSVAELRETLALDADFLHYVGHVDAEGLRCHDGHLDPGSLETIGPAVFLLNGCRSYDPGLTLVQAGAVGGVATYSDVGNEDAIAVGRVLAQLLNAGFSLRAAVSVARRHHVVGDHYVTVGDGGVGVVQSESPTPMVFHVERAGPAVYEVQPVAYPTDEEGMGTLLNPNFGADGTNYVAGGPLPTMTLSEAELLDALEAEKLPVVLDERLRWSTELASDGIPGPR